MGHAASHEEAQDLVSKSEQLKGLVSRLRSVPGVEGAALVSRDGLPVITDLPPSFDRETFSAMVAAMVGAAETALIEAGRGTPDRVSMENKDTRIIASGVNEQFLLVVSAKRDFDLLAFNKAVASFGAELRTLTA